MVCGHGVGLQGLYIIYFLQNVLPEKTCQRALWYILLHRPPTSLDKDMGVGITKTSYKLGYTDTVCFIMIYMYYKADTNNWCGRKPIEYI